jgi:serine/threonine-protein kinase
VLGTPDYVSPEQALGQRVTPQSDIYSLGIVLYEMLTGDVPFRADAPVAVAMKHVREPMPDVQMARPEVSAATAAIVERATAKEMRNRYRTIEEMLGDLERALAIEASRAGQTTGEATTVLRALPGEAWVPWRLRFPRRAFAVTVLAAAAVAVVVVLLATRTHESTPPTEPAQPPGAKPLQAVRLASTSARDYDPFGTGGEHPADVGKAIDHNAVTAWTTERYNGGLSTKPGVGLYVDAGGDVAARRLDLIANPSGWQATIYGAPNGPAPTSLDGWTKVSGRADVGGSAKIPLNTGGKRYRYYLVWITKLPAGGQAGISELTLNK